MRFVGGIEGGLGLLLEKGDVFEVFEFSRLGYLELEIDESIGGDGEEGGEEE